MLIFQKLLQIRMKRTTEDFLIKVSKVAPMVSFIDFHRPKYSLSENSMYMATRVSKEQVKIDY